MHDLAPGYHTSDDVIYHAEVDFPDAFSAITDVEDVPWERVDHERIHFSEHSLFIGHVTVDATMHKMSAYYQNGGNIVLFRRGLRLTRRECETTQLASPRAHVAERTQRPLPRKLKALCEFYFAAAGFADCVHVREGWMKDFEIACLLVGVGRGGIDLREVGNILQRLLGCVRKTEHKAWGQHMQEQLRRAWPGYKKYWR
ncbi:hypothetical protein BDW02DRAFT_501708 [Decorospora gaudefroyi]|uniref:Uncharacterized protein n=1 Tax=Decorospora gaudefroyi TaxID=184978 RepID=A0A6A5KAL8_9PLEO|nr:hypothetical protein BDW02DRAFT_501708 [Decorospora gaudefroyi]